MKAGDGGSRRLSVNPKWVGRNEVEFAQASLKVADSFAAVTFGERERPIGRSTGMNGHPFIVREEVAVICRI